MEEEYSDEEKNKGIMTSQALNKLTHPSVLISIFARIVKPNTAANACFSSCSLVS